MLTQYAKCHLCENPGEFLCHSCGEPICGNDARIRVICKECIRPKDHKYTLQQAHGNDCRSIENLVLLFWGDPVQRMFDQAYTVAEYPAIVVKVNNKVVGFISFTEYDEKAMLIVALGILPPYQGAAIGSALVKHVEEYAIAQKKRLLLVATSNDNLPALAFYQTQGFQLYEVAPNVIAEKLGGLHSGICNIPIRDELRLQKRLH